ncbi:MAG: hypothetical protein Q9159_006843 [Coniocarpon cinnabarinum]
MAAERAFGFTKLEGDTSLPEYSQSPIFPSIVRLEGIYAHAKQQEWPALQNALNAFVIDFWDDVKILGWSYRKRLDLWGNDLYLAHQYRTLHWWLQPTHTVVLGDLLGSQWIEDDEFERRADRYWNRVFRHGKWVDDEIANGHGNAEVLAADSEWSRRIINVPGNHDVGYAGDMTRERLARYEQAFGKANWDVTFALPSDGAGNSRETPSIRLVALNSMNLDSPVFSPELQTQTYEYINSLIRRSNSAASSDPAKTLSLVLTHIPLYKPAGVCTDEEYFTYHNEWEGGRIKEQNHLSREASRTVLEGVLGLPSNPLNLQSGASNRASLILTGHDHEGCSTYHYLNTSDPYSKNAWNTVAFADLTRSSHAGDSFTHAQRDLVMSDDTPGVREETLRSMMGEYGGHAGLVSAWYENQAGWQVEVGSCDVGVQHWWWGVHVLDLIFVSCLTLGCLTWPIDKMREYRRYVREAQRREERRRRELRRRSKSRGKSLTSNPSYVKSSTSMKMNGNAKGSIAGSTRGRSRGSTREMETPSGSIRKRRQEVDVARD